jgi:hypothetical protein
MGTFSETAISNYRLSFSVLVSVFSKQTKFCHFRFLFAANKGKLPFCVSSDAICGIPETWRHGDMETWIYKDIDMSMETWKHRHETWRHENMET